MNKKHQLIVFASGSGTTFEYLVKKSPFEVSLLVSNSKKAKVLDKANLLQIPYQIFTPNDYSSFEKWDQALGEYLKTQKADLIVLAGFLYRIGPYVLSLFKNKIINLHPSLLPKFGGKGMYGIHIHKAVIQAKESVTGSTIHYVDKDFDTGTIIAQKKIPVSKEDTPKSLQEKIKEIEKPLCVSAISQIFNHPSSKSHT